MIKNKSFKKTEVEFIPLMEESEADHRLPRTGLTEEVHKKRPISSF